MTRLGKWTMVLVAMSIAAAVQAAPKTQTGEELLGAAYAACNIKPGTMCWAAAANQLSRLDPPGSAAELEQGLFDHVMLGRLAHATGDYAEARILYDKGLSLATGIKGERRHEGEANFFPMLFKFEETELALSMRDYDAALKHIDAFAEFIARQARPRTQQDEFLLLRCAALIGLRRKVEADTCLRTLLEGLKFEDRAPWEGFPFGPQALNPFEAARRIAAHEARERRFDTAMNLLLRIEALRERALRNEADAIEKKAWMPGKLWAALLDPADIMEDKAAIFLAQGDDASAAPLLLAASALRRPTAKPGASILSRVDPLAETLGFLRARK